MKPGILLLLLAIVLSGCVASSSNRNRPANTLIGNDRLPHEEMGKISQARQWMLIRDLEYTGYVIMEGQIGEDGQVSVRKIVESYPGNSRDRLAYALGNNAVIHAATTGTKMIPKAMIYVIFYERLSDRNLAFIYAKQVDYSAPGISGIASYLNTVTY